MQGLDKDTLKFLEGISKELDASVKVDRINLLVEKVDLLIGKLINVRANLVKFREALSK